MKFLVSQIMQYVHPRSSKVRLGMLGKFALLLSIIVGLFSIIFHLLMLYEGRDFSWFSGVYWALTVMSTLGFGDITFQSDIGRFFSVVVLLTGMLLLLVMLPFTFIEFFYSPWMKAQQEARAPRRVSPDMKGHVILTHRDAVTLCLVERLRQYEIPYVFVAATTEEALEIRDLGYQVVRADLRQPKDYESLGLRRAAMLVATDTDVTNTSIAFTARNLSNNLPIAATANQPDSVDVLSLAGCDHVIELASMLGASLARRTIGGDAQAHLIGSMEEIRIVEATAAGTPLIGKSLRETRLRERTGLTVIGMWERGEFVVPGPEEIIDKSTVLVMAGTQEQVDRYNELLCIYHHTPGSVIIIGAGRVGRATGRALAEAEIEYLIVDNDPAKALPANFLMGSAADLSTLEKAGIHTSPTVIITTRDDDTNIYLTIYCRKLRPDIQIISRATFESNTARLHRAGADFVMSYASMGANILFNLMRRENILMVAEGLNILRIELPESLAGKALLESAIRERSGCSVIAVRRNGKPIITPMPDFVFARKDILLLIGTVDAEDKFLEVFVKNA
jgi:voltage-gated potassium channel